MIKLIGSYKTFICATFLALIVIFNTLGYSLAYPYNYNNYSYNNKKHYYNQNLNYNNHYRGHNRRYSGYDNYYYKNDSRYYKRKNYRKYNKKRRKYYRRIKYSNCSIPIKSYIDIKYDHGRFNLYDLANGQFWKEPKRYSKRRYRSIHKVSSTKYKQKNKPKVLIYRDKNRGYCKMSSNILPKDAYVYQGF